MAKYYLSLCAMLVCLLGVWSCQQKSNDTGDIQLVSWQEQLSIMEEYLNKPQDDLLEEAAKDDENAMYELARRADNPLNKKESFRLYLSAAKKGHSRAQNQVGGSYLEGVNGVEQDLNEAKRWLDESLKNGDPAAAYMIGLCHTIGKPQTPYDKNGKRAMELANAAINAGYFAANEVLGLVYSQGIDVEQDMPKAFSYFMKGAEAGASRCETMVGCCYYDGVGVEKDIEKAILWLQLAFRHDDIRAQNYLQQIGAKP